MFKCFGMRSSEDEAYFPFMLPIRLSLQNSSMYAFSVVLLWNVLTGAELYQSAFSFCHHQSPTTTKKQKEMLQLAQAAQHCHCSYGTNSYFFVLPDCLFSVPGCLITITEADEKLQYIYIYIQFIVNVL
jgi:hypothetical protein